MLRVKQVTPTKTFGAAGDKGTLFEFEGDICMSTGWPDNDVHYVILHSENPKKVGTTFSHHNGTPGITLLEGELTVWPLGAK